MGIYCDYKDCKVKRKEGKTFFKFPTTDMSRALIWAVYAGRPELVRAGQYAMMSKALCADHFDGKYFSGEKGKRLTKDALPNMHDEEIVNRDTARYLATGLVEGADALITNRQQTKQMVSDLPPLLENMTVTTNGANVEEGEEMGDDLEPPVLTMEDDNIDCRTEASITTNCNDSLLESYTINDNSDYIDEFSFIAIEEGEIPIEEIIEDRNDINETSIATTNSNSQYNIPECITVTELISDNNSIAEELLPSTAKTDKSINNCTTGIPNIEELTITIASNEAVNNETSTAKRADLAIKNGNQNANKRKANENGEGVTKKRNQNANCSDDIIRNIFAVSNSVHHDSDEDESTFVAVAKKSNLHNDAVAATNSIQNASRRNSIYNGDEVVATIRNQDANAIAQKADAAITKSKNQSLTINDRVTSSNNLNANNSNANQKLAAASATTDKTRHQNANGKQEVVAKTVPKNKTNKIGQKAAAATARSGNDRPTEATNNANLTNRDADEELETVFTNRNQQRSNEEAAPTINTNEDVRQNSDTEIPSYEDICAEFAHDSKRLDEIEDLVEALAVNKIRDLLTNHDALEWLRGKISHTLVGAVSLQLNREPHHLSEDERMFLFNIKDGLGKEMQRKLGWRIPMDALRDDNGDANNES